MDKRPRDVYRVEGKSLSSAAICALTILYLPLIGKNAYVLYMTLANEAQTGRQQESHQRLLSLCDMDIDALERSFIKLEEYMLLRSYVKEGENRNAFLYALNEPLSTGDFLENHIYMSRYMKVMGRQNTEDTISRLKAGEVSLQGYKDITTPVVYNREQKYERETTVYKKVKPQYQFSSDDQLIHFDYERFLATTSTLVFPAELRTSRNMSLIGRLATVYGLSADRMRILVSRSVNIDTLEFDEERLKILAERSQPDVLTAADPYSMSPISFLQSKQNGAQVSRTDKRILEHLALDMHFSNEVINIMMEYILKVSDNRINEKFVDMVAGEWSREGVATKQQALLQVKKDMAAAGKSKRVKIDMPAYMQNPSAEKTKANDEQIEAFRRLQKQMKE